MTKEYTECNAWDIIELVKIVSSKLDKLNDECFTPLGMTTSQASILLYLKETGAQKVTEIAGALAMAESNVSNICSRLENVGLIERCRQKDDKRVVVITLTEQALPKVKEVQSVAEAFYERIRMQITDSDMQDIGIGLRKLNMMLDLVTN